MTHASCSELTPSRLSQAVGVEEQETDLRAPSGV